MIYKFEDHEYSLNPDTLLYLRGTIEYEANFDDVTIENVEVTSAFMVVKSPKNKFVSKGGQTMEWMSIGEINLTGSHFEKGLLEKIENFLKNEDAPLVESVEEFDSYV